MEEWDHEEWGDGKRQGIEKMARVSGHDVQRKATTNGLAGRGVQGPTDGTQRHPHDWSAQALKLPTYAHDTMNEVGRGAWGRSLGEEGCATRKSLPARPPACEDI